MTVELKVKFPVDDAALSVLHHRAFSPDRPDADAATRPWASRLERYSLTWVGAFSSGRLVGFVHAVWDGGTHAFISTPWSTPTSGISATPAGLRSAGEAAARPT